MITQNQHSRPRLIIDISPELRRRIKIAAVQKDLSIREYVEQILELVDAFLVDMELDSSLDIALSIRAMEFAHQHKLPATYDPRYLALAERENCEYWTADKRLWNAVKDKLTWVRWFGDHQSAM